ncbi:DUF3054 domain-containing protein [Xylanimonas ulmi]|uniref:DUF3054 family protein n=1 Tax=Xylanimonas ulmi TaxID=228973 RepID=A0A4Q7M4R4_9MICO|nr:DUF3054 domain-containing protein [Xylanibacterium ulmi]RZS61622.1 DUF3054 family protein [Xylanibacterium ulmi]
MSESSGTGAGAGFTVTLGRAGAYDVVVLVVFLMFGSAAHGSADRGTGHLVALGATFFAGLAAGWALSRAWRAPARLWPTGVIIWLTTVVVGVVLRGLLIPDAGFEPGFLLITTGFLGVTLLGWRALARPPRRKS